MDSTQTTVFIVEDHPVMREGYESLIGLEPHLTLVGTASSAEDALTQICDLRPDVVVMDLQLPGVSGVELIKRLEALDLPSRILVVSAHEEALYGERTLRAGAKGYLMKDESALCIVDAIRKVKAGGIYLSDELESRLVGGWIDNNGVPSSPAERLTDRELEVFDLIGHGQTTREMAETLGLSPKTIESHRVNIKRKMGAETVPELIRQAVLWVQSPMLEP